MKFRIPDYYQEFQCIAEQCKHSCCIGWEIDIDEDTYEYYELVEGAFGERLRHHMEQNGERCFILEEGDRCPFLNQKNLCDICIELGEESLSEVCTEYPRFTLEYRDVREKCLALSCEEVGRILFQKDRTFHVLEQEIPEEWKEEGLDEAAEDEEPTQECCDYLEKARETCFSIIGNRTRTMEERQGELITYAKGVQKHLNDEKSTCMLMEQSKKAALLRLDVYDRLEILDEEWDNYQKHLREQMTSWSEEDYKLKSMEFKKKREDKTYEEEALLWYFIFRYSLKAVYDGDFYGRILFATVSLAMIRDMDLIRFTENQGSYSLEDRIDIARIYSREVEHSQENLDLILKAIHK